MGSINRLRPDVFEKYTHMVEPVETLLKWGETTV